MTPLEDVAIAGFAKVGPADLAVKLAKGVQLKDNPVIDSIVVTRQADGTLECTWSYMETPGELSELSAYLAAAVLRDLVQDWFPEDFLDEDEVPG